MTAPGTTLLLLHAAPCKGGWGIRQRKARCTFCGRFLEIWSVSLRLRASRQRSSRQEPIRKTEAAQQLLPAAPAPDSGVLTAQASIPPPPPEWAGHSLRRVEIARGAGAASKVIVWRPRRWIERVWAGFPEGCASPARRRCHGGCAEEGEANGGHCWVLDRGGRVSPKAPHPAVVAGTGAGWPRLLGGLVLLWPQGGRTP